MISSVLCPFFPALEGLHRLPFNQLLLLFLGMQFSTGSANLAHRNPPFCCLCCPGCDPLSEILQQINPSVAGVA